MQKQKLFFYAERVNNRVEVLGWKGCYNSHTQELSGLPLVFGVSLNI